MKDLIDRATGLISTTKLEKHLAVYEAQIEAEPRNPRPWLRHAEICQRLSQLPLAVVSYRTAALLLSDRHHYSQAAAALRMAIKLAPQDELLKTELTRIQRLKPSGLSDFYARAITERSIRRQHKKKKHDSDDTQIIDLASDERELGDSAGATEVVHLSLAE